MQAHPYRQKQEIVIHEADHSEDFLLFPQTASSKHLNEVLLLQIKSYAAPSEDQSDQLI